mmetsp:Transcript_72913/g.189834  ORF Transcript_72913/g.189834 Transcript_72913/m.189834 type:complete len:204 (-) Transcript_72913:488-1099(-)
MHEVLDLDLEGGLDIGGLDALGDLAQESGVPRGVDDARRIALQHTRAKEGQIAGLGGRLRRLLRVRVAGLRHGLACQCAVVDLHAVRAIEDANICRDAIACLQENNVTRNEVHDVFFLVEAGTIRAHADRANRLVALHFLHGLHGILGQHLGVPLEHGRGDDDDRQQDRRDVVVALSLLEVNQGIVHTLAAHLVLCVGLARRI